MSEDNLHVKYEELENVSDKEIVEMLSECWKAALEDPKSVVTLELVEGKDYYVVRKSDVITT